MAIDQTTVDTAFKRGLLCRVYGVRHLSPAAAHHLHSVLDTLKPTAVLVEGPSDATEQITHFGAKGTQPPLAILAYTKSRPVKSIIYPLAEYSPEWVALTWGIRNKAETRFIDLPASVFLQLHEAAPEEQPAEAAPPEKEQRKKAADSTDMRRKPSEHTLAYLDDPYEAIAQLAGDPDHETWWERHFEHTIDPVAYIGQIHEFGVGLRSLRELKKDDENLIREAWMRRCIKEVLADRRHKPETVLVVCGAFHSSALSDKLPPMTDAEFKALPKAESSLTLMPYSYFRLSAQSGYGAGNHAPSYFQQLYEERRAGESTRLPARFLSELCHRLRKAGHMRSAAEVIEAVRLAYSLAALNDAPAPTLRDLRDAALTLLGRGEADLIGVHLSELEIGGNVGKLPKGISRTSIQEDFYLQMESLFLEKYQTEKAQELVLDLREDRAAKTKESAFRDLNRSTFFHRLAVLEIKFGEKKKTDQQAGTWKEVWNLKWAPSSEIELVESSLLGDTVEIATAVRLSQKLTECHRVDDAAAIVHDAVLCQLADAMENARRRLQAMAVEETSFVQLSRAVDSLADVIRMGSVRKLDPKPLGPLASQLFLRATLSVKDACLCDDQTAREQIKPAILALHDVSQRVEELVDGPRWNRELDRIAFTDSLNAYLSGFVLSLILPRISEEQLATEVSKRLSRGIPPDLGAAWFEGLMQYNPEALFARMGLWRQLDLYVQSLDDQEFRRALVPLRRAFGNFATGQIRRVVSNLVTISQEGAEELKASVDVKLSDEEAAKLKEQLGDLDLGL